MVGITKDDGALPSRGLGGASEKSGLLVVLGYIGAQTWLPIVGVVADMYRGGDLGTVNNLAQIPAGDRQPSA